MGKELAYAGGFEDIAYLRRKFTVLCCCLV